MDQELTKFMDTKFLNVEDVKEGDIIDIVDKKGLTESFGKKKYQLEIVHDGKPRLVNLYPRQIKQIVEVLGTDDFVGKSLKLSKVSVNGGFTLNFSAGLETVKPGE